MLEALIKRTTPYLLLIGLLGLAGCGDSSPEQQAPPPATDEAADVPFMQPNARAEALLDEWATLAFPDNTRQAPAYGRRLAEIGPPALGELIPMLFRSDGNAWRSKVAEAYVEAMGERVIEPLRTLLTADGVEPQAREGAIMLAGHMGERAAPLTPAIVRWADQSDQPDLRRRAIDTLIAIATPADQIVDVALALVTSDERLSNTSYARKHAIRLLGRVGRAGDPARVADALLPYLDDSVYDEEAARSIGKLDLPPAKVVPPLVRLIQREIGREIEAGLDDEPVRTALEALAAYGPKASGAHAALLGMWDDDQSEALLNAIVATGSAEAMTDWLLGRVEPGEPFRAEAAGLLASRDVGAERVAEAVTVLLSDEARGVRRSAARGLASRIPTDEAARALVLRFADDEGYRHGVTLGIMVEALAEAPEAARLEAMPTLIDLRVRCTPDAPVAAARDEIARVLHAIGMPAARRLFDRYAALPEGEDPGDLHQVLRGIPADDAFFVEQLQSDEPDRRWAAVRVIAGRESIPPEAAEPLGAMLDPASGDRRMSVVFMALMQMGSDAAPALPAMIAMLDSPNYSERTVITTLAAVGEPAIEPLAALIREGAADEPRVHAAEAMTRAGPVGVEAAVALQPELDRSRSIDLWRGMYRGLPTLYVPPRDGDSPPAARVAAARTVLGMVESMHRDNDEAPRYWAAMLATEIAWLGEELEPILYRLIGDTSERVRVQAAVAAGRLGPAGASLVRDLRSMLRSSDDPYARRIAAESLGRIGPAAAEGAVELADALADREVDVRRACVRSLGQIGPGARVAVPTLLAMLEDSRGVYVGEVITALGRIGGPAEQAIPKLVAMLDTEPPDSDLHRIAAQALGHLGAPAAYAAPKIAAPLHEAAENSSDPLDEDNVYLNALARLGPEGARELVALYPKVQHEPSRRMLGRTIAAMGRPAALALRDARDAAEPGSDLRQELDAVAGALVAQIKRDEATP